MFGLHRNRQAGRHLEWKVRIFTVGAVLALAGMYFDRSWMVLAAIVVLGAGMALRAMDARRRAAQYEDDDLHEHGDRHGVDDLEDLDDLDDEADRDAASTPV